MKNKTKLFFISILIGISGCTSEEKSSNYNFRLLNNSTSTLTLLTPNKFNLTEIVELAVIEPRTFYDCSYKAAQSKSFIGCVSTNLSVRDNFDDLVFRFSNGKGYKCGFDNQPNLCFTDSRQYLRFDEMSYERIGSDILQITITQQDFDNAFDLP